MNYMYHGRQRLWSSFKILSRLLPGRAKKNNGKFKEAEGVPVKIQAKTTAPNTNQKPY
jgi:hypothetical protein